MSHKGVGRDKRLVAIPAQLVPKLMEISVKQGKSFQVLVSQFLTYGAEVVSSGHSLDEVVDFYNLMSMQKSSGAALLPVDLCNYMNSRLFETEKENVTRRWREAGSWYGRYLASKFPDRNFSELLGKLLKATRWDLSEVEVSNNNPNVRIRCIAPHLPEDSTLLLASFVEGAMTAANHKMVNSEVIKGMFFQEFARQP